MANHDSSLQKQSPLSQAQNSVESAHQAVTQAQTHPNASLVAQAEHAIAKANRSIEQADATDNQSALDMVSSSLEQDKAALNQLRS